MAWSLPTWHEPEEILRLASMAVAERAALAARRSGRGWRTCRGRSASATSTCRAWTSRRRHCAAASATGERIDFLVPDAVGAYIEQEGLYR